MKKYPVIIALLLSVVPAAYAQFESISAKELVATATIRAKSEWMPDAYLQNIVFVGGTQAGISFALDITNGKANAWFYAFYSPGKDSMMYYIGVKVPFVGAQIIQAPISTVIPTLPVPGHLEFSEPYIDTPAALQAAKDAGATTWLQSHPGAVVDLVVGINNPVDLPILPQGGYWVFRFNDTVESYTCWVNAATGVPAQCGTFTSAPAVPASLSFSMDPMYPQPWSLSDAPRAAIRFELSREQEVTLSVLDLLGRTRGIIYSGPQSPGTHTLPVDASLIPHPGVYFCRLETAAGSETRKFVVAR